MTPCRILVANFRWFGGFGAALAAALRAEGAVVDEIVCRNYEGLQWRRLIENTARRDWPGLSPLTICSSLHHRARGR